MSSVYLQNWKMLEPTCFYKFTKFCQILILTPWFLTLPCSLAKIAQILQKVIVFFLERGEETEPRFWHIWIAQWMKFFSTTAYIFRFRPSSGGNFWSKLVRLFSLILQFLSKQCFCLQEYYLCREFRQYWTIFGWVRAQKPHKKGHLMDAKSVRKTLKTFNLTISNAIMMKLTTIMYLQKRLNRKPLRTKNSILGVMSTNF